MGTRKDNFLAALGLITANFQVLEKYTEFFVWSLIGQDQEIGQIVTSQMSFDRICDTLYSLFRYRTQNSEMIKELDNIIQRTFQAEEKRNSVIHSSWLGLGSPDSSITRFKITSKWKKGLKHQYEEMTPGDLRKIALFIKQVQEELQSFIVKAQGEGIVSLSSYQIKTPVD